MCPSNRNKLRLPWVPCHSGIQANKEADSSAGKESSNAFLGPEPAVPISLCVGRLNIKNWLNKIHFECWAVKSGMRQSKLFLEKL
jgi:hypothetical protein